MKIMVAGSNEVWSLEKYYCNHLAEAGVEITVMPVQSIFYGFYNKSILHKILYKSGLSGIEQEITKQVKEAVLQSKPDVVWVFKGMEISPGLLQWIKQQGAKLVNYNPDNPFVFSGSGSGNDNVTRSVGLYDLHFVYDAKVKKRIEEEYKIPCKMLPFGYELSDSLYDECIRQREVMKLCFLGNPDKQRADFLNLMAESIAIDVYGEGWKKYTGHTRITIYPPAYGNEFWKTIYRYRVQLNLMRPHNPSSHNMRSFEIPGVGGIGLFQRTPDHKQYFEEGKEVFLFDNVTECIQQAGLLLNMSAAEAGGIRIAARKKSLQAGYSYRRRALQALTEMKKLFA